MRLLLGVSLLLGVRVLLGACVEHNQLDVKNYFYLIGGLKGLARQRLDVQARYQLVRPGLAGRSSRKNLGSTRNSKELIVEWDSRVFN